MNHCTDSPRPEGPTERIRVLYVDSDTDAAAAAGALERAEDRLDVVTAATASDGRSRLADDHVDCIVAACDLPDRTGIEFLTAVRDDRPEVPFFMTAEEGSDVTASDALAAGVTDYVQPDRGPDQYELLANRITAVVTPDTTDRQGPEPDGALRELAETTNDIFWMLTTDWTELVYINSAYEGIWGRSIEALEADTLDFLEGIHPDDRDRAKDAMQRLSGGTSVDIECRVNPGEAYGRWVWIQGEPVTDDTGAVTHVCGFARDITDRKDRERDRERTTRHLEALLETAGPAVIKDTDGRYQLMNTAAKEQLDIDPERDVVGLTDHDLFPEAVAEQFRAEDQEVIDAGEPIEREEEVPMADDRSIYHTRKRPLVDADGTVEGVCAISRDITERKDSQRDLREQKRQLQGVLDSVDASIWIRDLDSRFELVNQNVRAMFGLAGDADVVDEHPSDLFSEEIASQFVSNDREVIETGAPIERQEEMATERGTGTYLTRITPLFDDGELLATCGVATDITAQKERERRLERHNERLDQFASTLRHELRNPLNVPDGYLDVARETGSPEAFESCQTAVDQMQQLLEQTLSVLKRGEATLDETPLELGAMCEACWRGMPETGATVEFTTTREVVADEDRMTQLLGNLFRNAVEHGGPAVVVRVGDLETGFYVEDDGPGIPGDIREAVFEEGYSTSEAGTGLGLAVVEAVATAHGWNVRITDGPMGGARFEITDVEFA